MARKRKRDWPQLVYKVDAYPLAGLPHALWRQAKAMHMLWNDLIALREQARADTKDLDKKAAKPRWEQFNRDVIAAAAKSTLEWEARGEVLDRFQTASRRAFREGATLRPRYWLDKIQIPHRFTGGGMPVGKFFAQKRGERIRIEPVEPTAYELTYNPRRRATATRGLFGLDGGVAIPFMCHLDYPIPTGAIVKKALWCGTHNRFRKEPWQWSLQLVLEVPPVTLAVPVRADTTTAGLDLGWRLMGEGEYLRIGFLTDSAGRSLELRLPMLGTGTSDYGMQRALRYERMVTTIYDVWELDEKIGIGVEECKEKLRGVLDTLPPGFPQMRQGGLKKLLREWQEKAEQGSACAILREWEAKDFKLWRVRAQVYERLLKRKHWLYRNLAQWLTKTYRTIVWEGDLSTRRLAQQEEGPTLKHAAKFRQWAAIGELRSYIVYAAKKNGCDILGPAGAYSTRQCWECGDLVEEKTAALFLECPNGHRWDQDWNAAQNLLQYGISQEVGGLTQKEVLRKNNEGGNGEGSDIPDVLRRVAVPVHRG